MKGGEAMASSSISSDYMRGSLDPIILRVLLDGDSYGYEIIKAVSHNSGGIYELKEPSLYTSLKRLEALSCVTSYWGNESQGGRRKYYRITPKGRQLYETSLAQWKQARDLIDQLIERRAQP